MVLLKAASAAAALASLPGTLELLFLTIGAFKPRRAAPPAASRLRLAALVPAHNEESGIRATVAALKACTQTDCSLEVIVVADHCSDRTASLAAAAGARVIERANGGGGKGGALRCAFDALNDERFDGFLIVDADTRADASFADEAARAFADGADAVQARDIVGNSGDSWRTRLMGVAFMAINVLRPLGREGWGLSCGICGNGFGLSSRVLARVPFVAGSIVEDLEYHLSLVRAGVRVRTLACAVRAEMPSGSTASLHQRSRWEGGRLRIALSRAPALAREVLSGNFILLEPLADLLLLPLGFHACLLAAAAFGGPLVRGVSLFGFAVLAAHALSAVALGGGGRNEILALAFAPVYVVWKIAALPWTLLAARAGQAWRRTERAAAPEESAGTPVPLLVLGLPFHPVRAEESVNWCLARARSGLSARVATANLDFAARADSDAPLRRVLRDADLVVADGMPIVWLSRWLGPALPERVTGASLVPALAEKAAGAGISIFLMGGAAGVADAAAAALCARFPSLQIAGTFSPPPATLENMQDAPGIAAIRRERPGLVFAAFGCPKQEFWIESRIARGPGPVALGIGASLDFLAGGVRRCPSWIGAIGVEWIYRLAQEPSRLAGRYAGDAAYLLRALGRLAAARLTPDARDERPVPRSAVVLPEIEAQLQARSFLSVAAKSANPVVDLSGRAWLNSLELGTLLTLASTCAQRGGRLRLAGVGARVRALLRAQHLEDVLGLTPKASLHAAPELTHAR